MYQEIKKVLDISDCTNEQGLALLDLVNIFSGKWKVIIIGVLLKNDLRFSEIQRTISTITPKMLSKELQDLEANGIVERIEVSKSPVLFKYRLTESAKNLEEAFSYLIRWATLHRQKALC